VPAKKANFTDPKTAVKKKKKKPKKKRESAYLKLEVSSNDEGDESNW
jgi:hypothetical protein